MTQPATRSIVFVNNFAAPTLGGGEVHLMHLVRGALAAGWDVGLVAAGSSALAEQATSAGATVTELDFSRARLAHVPVRIRDAVASSGAQVLVGTGFLTNVCVRHAARGLDVAVVNIVHTEPEASRHEGTGPLRLAMRRRLEAAGRSRVDGFVAISSAVRNALCSAGADPARIHLIPNGVDIEAVRAEAAAHPLPDVFDGAGPVVGCIGRLAPVKGVEYFIRMAAALSVRMPHVRFVVAGSGPQESRLREIAYAAGLGEHLRFLGHVPSAASVIGACEVVVIPSLSEGFSLVAAEAMALAKPVVATRVGGVTDVVADGETGLLVPPADPEALAAAVARLLADPDLARTMGTAGARRAEEHFTLDRMVRGYLELFSSLAVGD